MTKRERLAATLARRPVDRPAIAFWRHVPQLDHDPRRLADAMLSFQARWDLDVIKVMSSGVYCVEDWGCTVAWPGSPNGAKRCTSHAVTRPEDWRRLAVLDPGAGALGRELEAVHRIAKSRDEDVPILHTLFSPLTVARKLAVIVCSSTFASTLTLLARGSRPSPRPSCGTRPPPSGPAPTGSSSRRRRRRPRCWTAPRSRSGISPTRAASSRARTAARS